MDKESYLIKEIKKGSEKAFVELYNIYWKKLYYVCYKRINSQEETEDIIQELFFDLWKKRETLEIKKSVGVYIFTALKYKIFRLIDSKNVRKKYLIHLDDNEPATDETIERDLSFEELYDLIEEKIEKLPDKCKLVFKMSRKENMNAEEISKKLDISKSTVFNQLTKAKKILRLELKKLYSFIFF